MNRTSSIYVWICPETGIPIYVGKTSQTLPLRLRSHVYVARRNRDPSSKYEWLRACVAKGKLPRVIVLETVEIDRSAKIERRWVRRLSARFKLANIARAGAGNPGVGRVDWTPEIDALLGKVPDSTIAKRLGCERKTVSYRRECLGIDASFDRTNNTPPPTMGGWNKKLISADIIAKLGKMPDYELAALAGSNKKRIGYERNSRGIPSFAAATGNDGRIKTGEPHRRWTSKRRYALSPDPKVASCRARQI